MTFEGKFKSTAFEAIQSAAAGLHSIGAIDKITMRSFDVSCVSTHIGTASESDLEARADTACGQDGPAVDMPASGLGQT